MHDPTQIDNATRVVLGGDRDEIDALEGAILGEVDRHAYPKNAKFAIRLALEEAVTNAIEHGSPGEHAGVVVEYRVEPHTVLIAVTDNGPGFDPGDIPDPTLEENLDKPSGRGLMLMRAYMTEVVHNDRGNRVLMRYAITAANGAS